MVAPIIKSLHEIGITSPRTGKEDLGTSTHHSATTSEIDESNLCCIAERFLCVTLVTLFISVLSINLD